MVLFHIFSLFPYLIFHLSDPFYFFGGSVEHGGEHRSDMVDDIIHMLKILTLILKLI